MRGLPLQVTRTTIDDLLRHARSRLERLEPAEALAAQEAGALLIDIRSGEERRRRGVIPGAVHMPRTVLEWRLDPDADPDFRSPHIHGLDQHLVLVCSGGFSTSLAAATLQDLGFTHATDLVGGFEAWAAAGLPVSAVHEPDDDVLPGMGDPDP
jgi:rhodanese-related sulfurtransferase